MLVSHGLNHILVEGYFNWVNTTKKYGSFDDTTVANIEAIY